MSPLSSTPSPREADEGRSPPEISATHLAAGAAVLAVGALVFLASSLIRDLRLPGLNGGLVAGFAIMTTVWWLSRRGMVRAATMLLAANETVKNRNMIDIATP